ncbi:Glutathione S-transferase [Solimonas aquatica]|uniref:Glutathione S-transferase n=1 Tax=Solimonas aquatica TaxID=489703 RepID=A0A1H9JVI2_9GAMM|nr:glutathione S-transferase family protein [Solimonas aquatica]SEQ90848.1 Glutathione S-transferase [Solimonas aquatica]
MSQAPYTLYLFWISYFSGKLQAYLRYKEIPHVCVEPQWRGALLHEILPNTGLMKVPVLRTPRAEWLADSTPIIEHLEHEHPAGAVLPDDPVQAFFCRLLEDYADEWLWRPALHYRWSHATDAHAYSRRFAESFLSSHPAPKWLLAMMVRERQRRIYVRGDGVRADTRAHVESVYLNTLDRLQAIFAQQPFLLGDRPCLADFGFFASMFRHFSLDPTPSLIMQQRAPAVFAWVARLWNTRCSEVSAPWPAPGTLPALWQPLLRDVGEAYLPYLLANARAWREGRRHFDFEVQGACYRKLPVVQYRVWCREQLQAHHQALAPAARAAVDVQLQACGALQFLLADGRIESGLYRDCQPPFCRTLQVGRLETLRRFFTGTHWQFPKLSARRAR